MIRSDGRAQDALRPVTIEAQYMKYAEGSALISIGNTRVLCAASIEDRVPQWMKGRGVGWVTAEYSMLPRATQERTQREASRGRLGGRTHEIQRIIGRSLRAVVDMTQLGERTVWLDCDVLQADGGTRTASITGAYVALHGAMQHLLLQGVLLSLPLMDFVAAVSLGIFQEVPYLDLNYAEDSTSEADLNIVMTGSGRLVEIQGTAERHPFTQEGLIETLTLARCGIEQLIAAQRTALGLA